MARVQRHPAAECRDADWIAEPVRVQCADQAAVWPRALGTERLYTGALSALDGISNAVAPALQSASIRAYVLTIIVTVVALVGSALAMGRALPVLSRWTPIQPHEAATAALIIAAAICAAREIQHSRCTRAGTVGYGIALIYVLFGAPIWQ